MAKKGQKFNSYSEEFKIKIIEDRHAGISADYIAKQNNISKNSVWTIIRKYERTGTVKSQNSKKGRRKEKDIDYKERYEILKKYQAFLTAQRERK
jgi:transposase